VGCCRCGFAWQVVAGAALWGANGGLVVGGCLIQPGPAAWWWEPLVDIDCWLGGLDVMAGWLTTELIAVSSVVHVPQPLSIDHSAHGWSHTHNTHSVNSTELSYKPIISEHVLTRLHYQELFLILSTHSCHCKCSAGNWKPNFLLGLAATLTNSISLHWLLREFTVIVTCLRGLGTYAMLKYIHSSSSSSSFCNTQNQKIELSK